MDTDSTAGNIQVKRELPDEGPSLETFCHSLAVFFFSGGAEEGAQWGKCPHQSMVLKNALCSPAVAPMKHLLLRITGLMMVRQNARKTFVCKNNKKISKNNICF